MNQEIKKPNFFIIGAPKCGTTSLSEYLRDHPNVFFSDPKEPSYFDKDFNSKIKFKNEEEYINLFKNAKNYKAVGEGSVLYLFSKEAVPNIMKFNPDAKFIVMLRNPIDMFLSLYRHHWWGFKETAKTPEEAWKLQESRKRGENIPRKIREPKALQYGDICSLGEQLERLFNLVPKEKVHIVFFEDFKNDTLKEYKKILEFLGLGYYGRTNFPVKNKGKRNKSFILRFFMLSIKNLKSILGIKKGFGLFNFFYKMSVKSFYEINNKERNNFKKDLANNFKKDLANNFKKDIQKIEKITGKKLNNWIKY